MTGESSMNARPARFPSEYGAHEDPSERMPWEFVVEHLEAARNYWIASLRPSGVPHVRPMDGVWVDGALCFGGSPEARWARNLTANPAISVNLPSDELAIILEGDAERVTDARHPLVQVTGGGFEREVPAVRPAGRLPTVLGGAATTRLRVDTHRLPEPGDALDVRVEAGRRRTATQTPESRAHRRRAPGRIP